MSSKKRKRDSRDVPQLGALQPADRNHLTDTELIEKYALSSPRVEVVPGLYRRIVRGRRSKNDAKEWPCSCGYINYPIRCLFFDIPRMKCGRCKNHIPDDYEFEFSLVDIEANGVCPFGDLKDQDRTPHCMLFSSSTNAEATNRVTRILLGERVEGRCPIISARTFMDKLRIKMQLPRNVDIEHYDKLSIKDLWKILEILESGVKTKDASKFCKISGTTRVESDFSHICKEIANGNPLLTYIMTGKRFDELKYNQIYKPPRAEKIVEGKSKGLHCIVLFGGGMRKGRKMLYKFANTWGNEFCALNNIKRKDGLTGGFGNIVAEGILMKPVKFIRDGKGILNDANLGQLLRHDESNYAAPKMSQSTGEHIHRAAAKFRQQYIFLDQGTEFGGMAGVGDIGVPMQAYPENFSSFYRDPEDRAQGMNEWNCETLGSIFVCGRQNVDINCLASEKGLIERVHPLQTKADVTSAAQAQKKEKYQVEAADFELTLASDSVMSRVLHPGICTGIAEGGSDVNHNLHNSQLADIDFQQHYSVTQVQSTLACFNSQITQPEEFLNEISQDP
ncbi:hypothetical protein ACP70R_024563 [Stipagrostis hirtigluma subsp. patula]